jgi:acetoin:2,6-dichlorophenolindophenol oxidoreductase subunit alpha
MAPALEMRTRQEMLRRMLEIRIAEEEIQKLFLQNLIRGTTHLCIGQEACSVGVAWAMQPGDTMTCTYRGHGHALALGMRMKALMAEMMGKQSGCCKGKGGSMHMTDAQVGLLGANAIVGAQLPIAVGAALTAQVKGEPHAAVTFFGDGAANIGAFHEALNLAAIWKLPVIFCCENNQYGEYSALHKTTPVADIATRAKAYNIPGVVVDGQDVEKVYAETSAAIERARRGDGPTLLEFKTYRFRGHSRTDTGPYRPAGELEEWLKRDPIDILKDRMISAGQLDITEFAEMKQAAETLVFDAIEYAKSEPYPPLEELLTDIYYEQ